MNFKLTYKLSRWLIVGIALIFIIYGILQATLTLFTVDKKITDEVGFVLFMLVAYLMVQGRKLRKSEETKSGEIIEESSEEVNIIDSETVSQKPETTTEEKTEGK